MLKRNVRNALFALTLTAMTVGFPGTVPAAHAEVKIAVVDFQRVLVESKAGQALQKQLDAQQKSLQDEVAKAEADLQATQQSLGKEQEGGKTDADLAQKKADFEKKVIDTRQRMTDKRAALEKSANASISGLRDQIGAVIGDLAQKNHYDLVLGRQAVLMADKSLDITDAVLKGFDAQGVKPAAAATKKP